MQKLAINFMIHLHGTLDCEIGEMKAHVED